MTIGACLDRHRQLLARWGTATPEDLLPRDSALAARLRRQRGHVEATLEGRAPLEHARQIEALLRGLDLVEAELAAEF